MHAWPAFPFPFPSFPSSQSTSSTCARQAAILARTMRFLATLVGRGLAMHLVLLLLSLPPVFARAVPGSVGYVYSNVKMVTNAERFRAGLRPLPPPSFVRRNVDGRVRSLPALKTTSTSRSHFFLLPNGRVPNYVQDSVLILCAYSKREDRPPSDPRPLLHLGEVIFIDESISFCRERLWATAFGCHHLTSLFRSERVATYLPPIQQHTKQATFLPLPGKHQHSSIVSIRFCFQTEGA